MNIGTGIFGMTFLFALLGPLVKILQGDLGTFQQMFLRMMLSSGAIYLVLRAVRSPVDWKLIAGDWRVGVGRSFLLTVFGGGFYLLALRSGNVGVVSLLTCLPYEAVWGAVLFGERIVRLQLLALLIGLGGVVELSGILVHNDAGAPVEYSALFAVLSGLTWGYGVCLGRYHDRRMTSAEVQLSTFVFGAMWAGVCAAGAGETTLWPRGAATWGVLVLSTAAVVGAFVILEAMIRRTTLTTVAVGGLLQPIWSFTLGYLVLGELPAMHEVRGGAIIGAALLVYFGTGGVPARGVERSNSLGSLCRIDLPSPELSESPAVCGR